MVRVTLCHAPRGATGEWVHSAARTRRLPPIPSEAVAKASYLLQKCTAHGEFASPPKDSLADGLATPRTATRFPVPDNIRSPLPPQRIIRSAEKQQQLAIQRFPVW